MCFDQKLKNHFASAAVIVISIIVATILIVEKRKVFVTCTTRGLTIKNNNAVNLRYNNNTIY